VQRGVAFNAFFVYVGFQGQQVVGDFVVAFVASDHQARVTVTVGYFDVCGNGNIRSQSIAVKIPSLKNY